MLFKVRNFMKLKIVFFALISLPILASEPKTSACLPSAASVENLKIQMPNYETILAILNSNNEGRLFSNLENNKTIALGLADKKVVREEVVSFLFETTGCRNVPVLSLKVSAIIDVVKAVERRPGLAQINNRK